MTILEYSILISYFVILFLLTLYGAHRYSITYLYYRFKKDIPKLPEISDEDLPFVTIQLPVFNERYVLERLVEAVAALDYPRDKMEIQILDDSTDDTQKIGRALKEKYEKEGYIIEYLHREDREGYKAGALAAGLKKARGEFIAVFDADFVPPPNFLRQTVPMFFKDDKIGMVQVRWEHINRGYSFLTKAQAIFLDGHFVIEHVARCYSGRFFNFNGTAGIWRKECIEEAGGWQHDTITEDLDLSYRAQLAGWKFIYLPDVVSPAELPVEMNAFRTQQHRWAKGSIETAKKLLWRVLKSDLPFHVKTEAIFHLTGNISYILMILLAILMPISIMIRLEHNLHQTLLLDMPFLIGGTLPLFFFYASSQKEINAPWIRRSLMIPFALALGVGISLNNGKAVLEALFGHKTGFTRTPKYNVKDIKDSWKNKIYRGHKTWLPYIELLFAIYFTIFIIFSLQQGVFSTLPFLVLFQVGFLYVSLGSIWQR